MNRKKVLYIVGANLALLLILSVLLPQHMVQPGRVMEAHRALETDCFACHTPFLGSRSERCIQCHKPEQIGLVTTKGMPIGNEDKLVPFHQGLIEKDCVACHSDHKGVQAFYPIARFSHDLLQVGMTERCGDCHRRPADDLHRQVAGNCGQCHTEKGWTPATFDHDRLELRVRGRCVACHRGPDDKLHRQVGDQCGQCHTKKAWTPATFNHDSLAPRLRGRCESCHARPGDTLHREVGGNCGQCHTKKAWTPAAFNHNRFFHLDGNHRTTCTTCHRDNDYSHYTCYGCHAHFPSAIRAVHREEGIAQYENCVKCHRSGSAEEGERDDDERGHRSGRSGEGRHGDGGGEEHEGDDD
jgi:hypothetical protein